MACKGRAEILRRVIKPVNIRSHHPHIVLARHGKQLVLQRLLANLSKARRDHHRARNFASHFVHCSSAKFRWDRKHRDIDFLVHFEHGGIGLASYDLLSLRMNRIDRAAITSVIRFFITELPILPSSSEAPITATDRGFIMRCIARISL